MPKAAKAQATRVQTGVVTLKYTHLVSPDPHFNPLNPDYNVTFVMPEDVAKTFIAEVERLMPAFKNQVPFKVNQEGLYEFKVKQKKFIEWIDQKTGERKREEFVPVLLNSDNTAYEGAEPWAGTTGEVAINLGITKTPQRKEILALRLKGVRFHDVVGGQGGSGDPLFGPAIAQGGAEEDEDVVDDGVLPFN